MMTETLEAIKADAKRLHVTWKSDEDRADFILDHLERHCCLVTTKNRALLVHMFKQIRDEEAANQPVLLAA